MTNEPLLTVENLSQSFRTGAEVVEVLRSVNFTLLPGATASIQGASGSGKTTLLNLISGLQPLQQGRVCWQGMSISTLGPAQLHQLRALRVGFVFQHYSLLGELSVLENILLPGRLVGRVDKARAQLLAERVDMEGKLHAAVRTLSGGEKQRVALARALYNSPKLILADEPTGNLDEHNAQRVMDLLWQVVADEKAGLVLITHNARLAAQADFKYQLSQGQLLGV